MHEIQAKQCPEEYSIEIDNSVSRYREATGPLMKLANFAGSKIESVLEAIPDEFEKELQNTIKLALEKLMILLITYRKMHMLQRFQVISIKLPQQ
jgi:hypothetical protein